MSVSVEQQFSIPFKDIAGLYVLRFGCVCFPLVGKSPALGTQWRERVQGTPGIHGSDKAWEAATGYAVAPVTSSKVVIIDADSAAFVEQLLQTIPRLAETFSTQRGDHRHFYVTLDVPLPKAVISLKNGDQEISNLRSLLPAKYGSVGCNRR